MKKPISAEANEPSHVTKGSIFDDLGFSEKESAALKIKAELFQSLLKAIKRYKLKQRDLQRIFDQPQSRVSELLTGKISTMSIEKLLNYLDKLGAHASVEVKVPKKPALAVRQVLLAHG